MSTESGPHRLSENDLRQCLRIAGGGTLGLFICKVFNLEYGAFFVSTRCWSWAWSRP